MRQLTSIFFLLILTYLISCKNSNSDKVKNTSVVNVVNGMDKVDTVRYTCDSCDKFIANETILKNIIDLATNEAKNSLNNPLSFIPRSIKITVARIDSLFYYRTNKKVDSCLIVGVDYESIGKNAYGTEGKVNTSSLIFLVGDSIRKNFLSEIRKQPLSTANEGKTVDRKLNLEDVDGEGNFSILPTLRRPYSFVVKSSISCIDKDATLTIVFEDKSEKRLHNWNDFNCDGTAYFNLNADVLQELKLKKVNTISFYSDKSQYAVLPENDQDYLMQYVNLIEKK